MFINSSDFATVMILIDLISALNQELATGEVSINMHDDNIALDLQYWYRMSTEDFSDLSVVSCSNRLGLARELGIDYSNYIFTL